MRAVIHQPYFIPWLGYFAKFLYADKFIVLDNVLFSKGFYVDRTKYVGHDGNVSWLSLPIGNHTHEKINKISISDKTFVCNHIKTLYGSYRKADFFNSEWADVKEIIESSYEETSNLVELDIFLIEKICRLIELELPKIAYSSKCPNFPNNKTERVTSLLKYENCNSILIGDGDSLKVHNWRHVINEGYNVCIQNFYGQHPKYKQVRRQQIPFAKGVSIIDSILNIGRVNTLELLKSDIYKPFNLDLNG